MLSIKWNIMHTMINKLFKRNLLQAIEPYLGSGECLAIYGARQVGKSTLLRYLMQNYLRENVFYLDLELGPLLDLCNKGAEETYRYVLQKGAQEQKKIYLVIDEIQYLEDPASFIKVFHDHYPQVKLLVSGSSTFQIKKKFRQSLAGRIVAFELYPLNFAEFLLFKGKEYQLQPDNSETINKELVPLAEEFIRFGGYPQIVLEESEEKKQTYLAQLINTYVRKDIRDIGNIRNISSFNRMLEILAAQSGQLLNVLEISNTMGISRTTVLEYLDLLENTFIIRLLRPFHQNIRSELSKNPKIFLMDTGMMHLLWLKEFPKTIFGNTFETFVYLELVKAGKKINFWRTTNKQEVDFIVSGKGLQALEAKLNFNHSSRKALRFFSEKYQCRSRVIGLYGQKEGGSYIWEFGQENG